LEETACCYQVVSAIFLEIMNPWLNIWTRVTGTIDHLKNSNWVDGPGLIPFAILGINGAADSRLLLIFDYDSGFEEKGIALVVLLAGGAASGLLIRLVWVNLIFRFGKIWKGNGTKRNIATVLSLSLIPQTFGFLNLIESIIVNQGDLRQVRINNVITVICFILSFRILVIGLSRVQRFSYGLGILNLIVPQFIFALLYLVIKG